MPTFSDSTLNEMMISGTSPFSTSGNVFTGNNYAASSTLFQDAVISSPNKDLFSLIAYSAQTRRDYLTNLTQVLDVDASRSIIDIYSEKSLYASKEDDVFTVKYCPKNREDLENGFVEEIDFYFQDFIERVDLYSFLKRMFNSFLLYGEYPYRKEFKQGEGITKLIDDISVADLVGIYENGRIKKFCMVKDNNAVEVSKESYGHFILDPIRVKELNESSISSFEGETAVMGKSILYAAIEALKNLRTNQIVALMEDIKKILRPSFYGVTVPETMNTADVTKLLRKYERDFRSPVDALGRGSQSLTINDIVYLAAQIRFIPQFSNGKGKIEEVGAFNNKDNYEANLAKKNAILQNIAVLVGLPPSYLSPGMSGNPEDKVSAMKIYARFAKKLVMIQDCLEEGLIDLFLQDIYYRTGYRIRRDSVKIFFKSTVDSELLDTIEFTMGNVEIGDRILALVNNVTQAGLGLQPKPKVLKDIFNRLTNVIARDELFEMTDTGMQQGQQVDGMVGSPSFGGGGFDMGVPAPESDPLSAVSLEDTMRISDQNAGDDFGGSPTFDIPTQQGENAIV